MFMQASSHRKPAQTALLLMLVLVLASACAAPAAPPTATPEPTATEPPPTATPIPTNTPLPTDTPTPLPTPTPTRTATPDRKATQAAQATQTQEALLALVSEDLQSVGLTTEGGKMGYYSPEDISIANDAYAMIYYDKLDPFGTYGSFVLHSDIEWNSTSGLAGCGFLLRVQEPFLEGKLYMLGTWRLSGYPAWDLDFWNYGRFQSSVTGRTRRNDAIKQDNDSLNQYIIVANGGTLTAYVNGTKLGTAAVDGIKEGKLGIFSRQESGTTTCTFKNTWVWMLPEGEATK